MAKRAKYRWLLKVVDGRNHDLMLHRLGLLPSRYDASEYVAFYAAESKPKLLRHIEALKRAGLHGLAKRVAPTKRQGRRTKTGISDAVLYDQASQETYRNARKPRAPSAQVLSLVEARQARSQREAKGRRAEKRHQARQVEQRDAADAAHRHAEELIRSKQPL